MVNGYLAPKTAASYRKIKIGNTLVNLLKKHKSKQKQNKWKYGEHYHQSNLVYTKVMDCP
jgi:hypothetical protein